MVRTIVNNPEFILADEPTGTFNPMERIRIQNFISEIEENKIVILAKHVVSDIEFVAKDVTQANKDSYSLAIQLTIL